MPKEGHWVNPPAAFQISVPFAHTDKYVAADGPDISIPGIFQQPADLTDHHLFAGERSPASPSISERDGGV
jgi:hypothetical protein